MSLSQRGWLGIIDQGDNVEELVDSWLVATPKWQWKVTALSSLYFILALMWGLEDFLVVNRQWKDAGFSGLCKKYQLKFLWIPVSTNGSQFFSKVFFIVNPAPSKESWSVGAWMSPLEHCPHSWMNSSLSAAQYELAFRSDFLPIASLAQICKG